MAVMQVNPTRMELTRLKRRLVTAKRGHKLLKDKRDEMVRQFILLIRRNQQLRKEVEQELSGALREFAFARAVMEPAALEAAVLYPRSAAGNRPAQRDEREGARHQDSGRFAQRGRYELRHG